ncbi:MAG: tetratricopeptide repeat protein [bacterium]
MTNDPQTSTDLRLLARLREVDEMPGLIVVTGLGASEIAPFTASLGKELAGAGVQTVVFDPHSGAAHEQTLHGVVASLVGVVNAAGGMSEDAISSLETYEEVRRPAGNVPEASQGRLRHEVLGDLLASLSTSAPFVVLCNNLVDASAGDLAAITYLASNVFSDPIENLAPELLSERRVHGALVMLGEHGHFAGAEVFNFSDDAATKIRAFLSTEETVERIVEAIGGDLNRLAQLVEQLPESAKNFQWARFQTMDPQVRDIVEFFAAAGSPVSSDVAKRALGLLERSEFFGRAVKDALGAGLLRRSVAAGEVKIWVEDAALAEHILEDIDSDRLREIHRALANAERLNPDAPDSNFIARHFLKADDLDEAQEYVLHACQGFANRGAWDEALSLLDVASGKLDTSAPLLEIRLEALTATGRFRDALSVADKISVDASARPAFDLRVGRLLLQLSEFDAARARFESASLGDAHIQLGAELGLAECDYALGKLPSADERLVRLIQELDASNGARAEIDRLRILAQNLRGRVAIFQARYDEASDIFEANRVLAAQWAWEDEVARADANLGVVAMQLRDHAEALSRLQTALKSHGMRGARPRAYGLVNLATIYQRLDEHHSALEACLEGLRCARRSGDDVAYGVAAHNLATIYQDMGAFERGHAIIDHLHATPEHRTMVSRWSRLVQGYLYFDEHRFNDAKSVFEELAEGDQLLYQAEAKLRLAQCHISLGQVRAAQTLLDAHAQRRPDGDEPLLEALTWSLEAQLCNDEPEQALELSQRALERFRDLSQRTDTVHAACMVASALASLGRDADARAILETEMQEVVRRATYVPDEFQNVFSESPSTVSSSRSCRRFGVMFPSRSASI